MPGVVPRLSSILFDGTNNAEVEAVVTDPNFSLVESSETRIRWQMTGESEPSFRTVNADQWLLYGPTGSGMGPTQTLSGDDYAAHYREIS